jgi:hypothetical protein
VNEPFSAYDYKKWKEPYLFISYAHADSEQVYPYIQRLHDDGFRIWYDEGIEFGRDWDTEVATALAGTAMMVLFISPTSVQRPNVKRELVFATDRNKPVVSLYLKETTLPLDWELRLWVAHHVLNIDAGYGRVRNDLDQSTRSFAPPPSLIASPTQSYKLGKGLDLNPSLFVPEKKLIVPDQEIISSISIANQSLLTMAKHDPNLVHKLTPREFEKLVCELLEKQPGCHVELTKQTHDGGKDIIVVQETLLGRFLTYVECKKHNKDRPVSVELVRAFYGTIAVDRATSGLLVTSSYFSREAEEFTRTIEHQMKLMDYYDLLQEINKPT